MQRLAKRLAVLVISLVTACPVFPGWTELNAAVLLIAAENGDPDSQLNLGRMYRDGEGVPKDAQRAAFWFRKAAEQGHVEAQFILGWNYDNGDGVPKDPEQALFWYHKAASQGDALSQVHLGHMYDNGIGVPKDEQQAAVWFRKAAEQGVDIAQFWLGDMYARGRGLPKDEQEAVLWYRKAAEQGHAIAQRHLGLMFANGRGVPRDDQQAVVWYRKSADQGHADGQVNLGSMYAQGRGVPKDEQGAVLWYRKAAEQGNASAQLSLGLHFSMGEGVPKDDQQAYFWALLSASQGLNNASTLRDLVERKLTPQQRASAQAAARDWKPKVGASTRRSTNEDRESGPAASARRGDSPDSSGSAFYVASERVVTNHHVTDGCRQLRINGQSEGRVLSSDASNDLTLIALKGGITDVATIRAGRVKVGESATVVGFPLNGLLSGFNVTTGNVSSLAGVGGDTRMLQITAPVQPGNSGGPLLDAGGKVMGVVVSKLNALKVAQSTGDVPQNVNFAINGNVLASFLDANGVDYKTAPTGSAISTQEIARRAQAFTVLVECWK